MKAARSDSVGGLMKMRLRRIDIVVYSEEDVHQFPQLTDEIRQRLQACGRDQWP